MSKLVYVKSEVSIHVIMRVYDERPYQLLYGDPTVAVLQSIRKGQIW